jgi:hypothetical protein
MWHANIKTTMTFYANVDDAVERAVLGEQCNTSRNTSQDRTADAGEVVDVTTSQGTPSSQSLD